MASWCLFHNIYFQSPLAHTPVEVKTVALVPSPADGPLIVLKQTCRHWESKASVHPFTGTWQAAWMRREEILETSGESIALCSCVSRLCLSTALCGGATKHKRRPTYPALFIEPNLCGCLGITGEEEEKRQPLSKCSCQGFCQLQEKALVDCVPNVTFLFYVQYWGILQ